MTTRKTTARKPVAKPKQDKAPEPAMATLAEEIDLPQVKLPDPSPEADKAEHAAMTERWDQKLNAGVQALDGILEKATQRFDAIQGSVNTKVTPEQLVDRVIGGDGRALAGQR